MDRIVLQSAASDLHETHRDQPITYTALNRRQIAIAALYVLPYTSAAVILLACSGLRCNPCAFLKLLVAQAISCWSLAWQYFYALRKWRSQALRLVALPDKPNAPGLTASPRT